MGDPTLMERADVIARRIRNGRAYVKEHPDDDDARRLLFSLETEADKLALEAVAPWLARFGGRVVAIRDVEVSE